MHYDKNPNKGITDQIPNTTKNLNNNSHLQAWREAESMYKHFCKKIGNEYFCTAKNRRQQQFCHAMNIDQFDDHCQYMGEFSLYCNLGRLIEIDQETYDAEGERPKA